MIPTKYSLMCLKGIYALMVVNIGWLAWTQQFSILFTGLAFGWVFHWIVGSITIHRYITHGTFKMSKPFHIVLSWLGNLALVGSTISWASMHRTHHSTSDTNRDPHSPTQYSAFSLFFLTVDLTRKDVEMLNVKDLVRDKWLNFLHKYYLETVIVSIGVMWLISPVLVQAYLVGVFYTLIGIFFSVYVYHKPGPFNYRTHATSDCSYNNVVAGWLFHGEGCHNNHHASPRAITNAEQWYEWDMNELLVNIIKQKGGSK